MCDDVFGLVNFIAQVVWERAYAPINLKKHFSESHDYIQCLAKNKELLICKGLPRSEEANERYSNPDNDPRGVWQSDNLSVGPIVESKVYEIITPSGRKVLPPRGYCWRLDKKRFKEYLEDNRIWFGLDGKGVPRLKRFLSEVKNGVTPMTLWKYSDVGHSQYAAQQLKKLFDGNAYFDYPKPVDLLKRCLLLYSSTDSLILDFFSGSSTTAHAVMQLNAEDGGTRKFIMVQLPEACDEQSEAYKAGYKNICEIGKERIRRAGEKVKADHQDKDHIQSLDIGFRVLKLDSTNMKDVYYAANAYSQDMLAGLESNIKDDRTDLDLLYGVMVDWGLPLSLKHQMEDIDGVMIHTIDVDSLVACFAENVSEKVIREIAKRKPMKVVFRDSSFASSPDRINIQEIFKSISPHTDIKVL
jgi:adenine-specific DNA-methyltransferase